MKPGQGLDRDRVGGGDRHRIESLRPAWHGSPPVCNGAVPIQHRDRETPLIRIHAGLLCRRMRDVSGDNQADDLSADRKLGRWERWTTDWNGEPIIEFDSEAHEEWLEKWAPECRRRVRRALGFWERSSGELELRVPLGGDDRGVCRVILDERDDEVYVRVLVCCCDDDDNDFTAREREYKDCPVRVWLKQPLAERAVIDVDSDDELPLYVPRYLDDVRQPDHGYHPVNRRRRVHRDAMTDDSR